MNRNIEIKTAIPSIAAVEPLVRQLTEITPVEIFQHDTFFPCDTGRLKLRQFSEQSGELIFYRRSDQIDAKTSFYQITKTSDPTGLRSALASAYGITGEVIKHRTLYLVGQTRVHLDRVEGLGEFLELEVVLTEQETEEQGQVIADKLIEALKLDRSQFIAGAYLDLLQERKGTSKN